MKIWIVKASSGIYEDYSTWNVKAFISEDEAVNFTKSQSKYDPKIDEEYQKLEEEYRSTIEVPGIDDVDLLWDEYEELIADVSEKAFKELSQKYPNYDLNMTEDFHGYYIEELEMQE